MHCRGSRTKHSKKWILVSSPAQQQLLLALHVSPGTKQKLAFNVGDNQRRHDAEVQRRLLNGLVVGDGLNAQETVPALIPERVDSEPDENLRAEVNTLKRKLKRKYQEQAELNEDLVACYVQAEAAEARIKELEEERGNADKRDRDLAQRLKQAEDVIKALKDTLSRKEDERRADLSKLAAEIQLQIEKGS
ncbi:hypothetical protein B0H17DRAFT_1126103 [Mycena rosella]|uniref:Uncharacterized protein n=1 Tax=Mycena rosella TaxID=1033263 RepID=A0AAD7GW51_MYCRO|nr:hypothetical protein B0H17DRAFT_1126103 [Mycena rosella]